MARTIGFIVWWDIPNPLEFRLLSKHCTNYRFRLKLPSSGIRTRKAIESAIRFAYPESMVSHAVAKRKYREFDRYQVIKKIKDRDRIDLETVDFVRVYKDGSIVCEWLTDHEQIIRDHLQIREEVVLPSAFNHGMGNYLLKACEAIKLGHAYLVPSRFAFELKRITSLFRSLVHEVQVTENKVPLLYVYPIRKEKGSVRNTAFYVVRHYCNELNSALELALKADTKAAHKRAIRKKHHIKKMVRKWELKVGTLYKFRRYLSKIVTNYPELQDLIDERSTRKRW